MKGQVEPLSTILMIGVLISVIGTLFLWGLPLIQKNKDISTLENTEAFVKNLNTKIKFIVNSGGRDEIPITVPGIVMFNSGEINIDIDTQGTIYSTDVWIPLGKNDCSLETGIWGDVPPDVVCVRSQKAGENKYLTTYSLKYITLKAGIKNYRIKLSGDAQSAGEKHFIYLEKLETVEVSDGINTTISVRLV